ncbi:MAG: PilZ domain-containing protein [Myxococcota bacterium]
MSEASERRRAPRVRARLEASYEDPERQVFLRVRDLSELGMFLVTEDLPELGIRARVLLELPGHSELLRLGGVVARQQDAPPRGFAIEFEATSASPRAYAALGRFVESRGAD